MRRLLAITLLCFCQITFATSAARTYIVEPQWLSENLSRQRQVIVDVRSPSEYRLGHIPGAINLPVDNTFDKANRIGHIAPVSQIQLLFSKTGINHNQELVLYDGGHFIDAARLFWVLEVFGHNQVAILNMGFDAWEDEGLPVTTQPYVLPPSAYAPAIADERLATAFSTRLAIEDPDYIIIDSRSEEEYKGMSSKAERFGHIPRATSVPWNTALFKSASGHEQLKPLSELKALFSWIKPESRVITYCNKGKQSALTYFVLRNLGHDVAAYDGSWAEWGNDTSLPVMRIHEVAH